jgi:hypothetical protein
MPWPQRSGPMLQCARDNAAARPGLPADGAGGIRSSFSMKPAHPLTPDGQKLVLEVTKQIITLSVVALGFLTSMLFTTFKGTPFIASAMTSLFSFLLSASAGVLTQLAVVGESMHGNQVLAISYPRLMLYVTWIMFVCGLVAFVVFTWANVKSAA